MRLLPQHHKRRSLYWHRKKQHLIKHLATGMIVVGLVVLMTGVVVSLRSWRANSLANHQAAQLVYEANHNETTAVPSTIKPTESSFASYTVAANLPRYIFIPKLNVSAIVRPLGLTSGNQLAAPSNVFDVGWYINSSKPGQAGAMVVDGHVSSWTTNGVFYGLKTLVKGDQIQIERGDDSRVTYTVVSKQTYSATQTDMTALFNPVNPSKPGLNLITCTGTVEPGTSQFNERVIVFAEEN